MRKGQGAFEYILLIGGIMMISLVAFFLLRGTAVKGGNQLDYVNCKTQFSTVSVCFTDANVWNTTSPEITYPINQYSLRAECFAEGGPLFGSSWSVPGDPTRFTCGSKAP